MNHTTVYTQFTTVHINQCEPHHSIPTVHNGTPKPTWTIPQSTHGSQQHTQPIVEITPRHWSMVGLPSLFCPNTLCSRSGSQHHTQLMVNETSSHWVTIGSQSLLGLQNTWLVRPKRLLHNLPKVLISWLTLMRWLLASQVNVGFQFVHIV
jgi:hypothetical protein